MRQTGRDGTRDDALSQEKRVEANIMRQDCNSSQLHTEISFHKDISRLGRIIFGGIMGTLTMLVVTMLLYEAVLTDELPEAHETRLEARVLTGTNYTTTPHVSPSTQPEALPIRQQQPNFRVRPDDWHRRKAFYRKKPTPFKPKNVKSDLYMSDNETDQNVQATYHRQQVHRKKPNSIQDIISYLTNNKTSKVMQKGLQFSGSFNHPQTNRGPKFDPVEDYHYSGDPGEVNSALLGYIPPPTRSVLPNSNNKPIPVSLMLDIYPVMDSDRRKQRRRQPPTHYPPSRLLSRPPHMVGVDHQYPSTGPFRPDVLEVPPMRDHEMRPSFVNSVKSPHVSTRREREPNHHKIRLHLNFYPQKKGSGGLYNRLNKQNTQYTAGKESIRSLNSASKPNNNLWISNGWSPSTWTPEASETTELLPGPLSSTVLRLQSDPNDYVTDATTELSTVFIPQNHRKKSNRLNGGSTIVSANKTARYGILGSHGYTYEVPSSMFFNHEEPAPEPRNE